MDSTALAAACGVPTVSAINVTIDGHPGQRVGSFGFPNTTIEVNGPASDDVGWLNAGAQIIVHGHAGNGVANAMAQGKICVAGNIGARGMTMTKHNPRFDPPELWVWALWVIISANSWPVGLL